jgi:hypothetical protein
MRELVRHGYDTGPSALRSRLDSLPHRSRNPQLSAPEVDVRPPHADHLAPAKPCIAAKQSGGLDARVDLGGRVDETHVVGRLEEPELGRQQLQELDPARHLREDLPIDRDVQHLAQHREHVVRGLRVLREHRPLELLDVLVGDLVEAPGTEEREQAAPEDALLRVDAARLVAVGAAVVLDEPRRELLERGDLDGRIDPSVVVDAARAAREQSIGGADTPNSRATPAWASGSQRWGSVGSGEVGLAGGSDGAGSSDGAARAAPPREAAARLELRATSPARRARRNPFTVRRSGRALRGIGT